MRELRRGGEVDVGAEGSDENYCEELQPPEEEAALDVCQSSRTCPLPKAGAPATGPPAIDPPCRSNKPSCWPKEYVGMVAQCPRTQA